MGPLTSFPFPPEYCLASSKVGRCRGSFPRWYYDPKEQICKSFVYGGCLGNKNNYLREEECKLACRDVQGGPLWGSFGAQVTFPMGGLSEGQGSGQGSPPFPGAPVSSFLPGPGTDSSHSSVFFLLGPSLERHGPGELCSFPHSPHLGFHLTSPWLCRHPSSLCPVHSCPHKMWKDHKCPTPCCPAPCQDLPSLCAGRACGRWGCRSWSRGHVIMPCWGRGGQVDDGLLVPGDLCLSLTSPLLPSCPTQCALAPVTPPSSAAATAVALTASWSVTTLPTAPMPPTRPPVRNVRPRRGRGGGPGWGRPTLCTLHPGGDPCGAWASELSSLQTPMASRSSRTSTSAVTKVRFSPVPRVRTEARTAVFPHCSRVPEGPAGCVPCR